MLPPPVAVMAPGVPELDVAFSVVAVRFALKSMPPPPLSRLTADAPVPVVSTAPTTLIAPVCAAWPMVRTDTPEMLLRSTADRPSVAPPLDPPSAITREESSGRRLSAWPLRLSEPLMSRSSTTRLTVPPLVLSAAPLIVVIPVDR